MHTFFTAEMGRQRRDALVQQADVYRLTHPRWGRRQARHRRVVGASERAPNAPIG